jgi:hypothetical protein
VTSDLGVLLPVRIETRFKNGDLWLRVVPDEPWFVHDDPRMTPAELAALERYVAAPFDPSADVPAAWLDLAAQVGSPRAVYLHRTFVTVATDGTRTVRTPTPDEERTGPALPRIVGFPTELAVWSSDANGLHQVLSLTVDPSRLTADFPDTAQPGDRRWWQDWDEAVAVGVAGVIPAASLAPPIDALYVIGLGEGDPAELFAALADDGRLGLLELGLPTNSVDGAPAAPLSTDPASWWAILQGQPGDGDRDVSTALTGDPARLGNLPGGDQPQRATASALVTALWPALWGFSAAQVFDVAHGNAVAEWAAGALLPEGAYPVVRVTSQPYGLLPVTAWSQWQPDSGDPVLEVPLIRGLLVLRAQHAETAETRGTAEGKDTDGLLDLIADTPSSGGFRFRQAWPLELWWLGTVSSGLPVKWPAFAQLWTSTHALAGELQLTPPRRYGTRGPSRNVGLPLVVPLGATAADVPGLLVSLADAATSNPAAFANTATLEANVLGGHAASLLLRLAIRSLQLVIGDVARARVGPLGFDPEPFAREPNQPGRLQQLITGATPVAPSDPPDVGVALQDTVSALRALAVRPTGELERRLRATIDASSHRIDPWLVGPPQRRLDALQAAGSWQRRLGAYGWVDAPAPGVPGPTTAGLLHTPSASSALAAAGLRDRAVSDPSGRWQLDITSRGARIASRIAGEVRDGAFLAEVMGREVERIVADPAGIETLRNEFPVRTEHAGRRVCDGVQVLAADPFPVALDTDQQAAIADLRTAIDNYGDLLVADAVHQLVEGRADIAGQVMDGAAGLGRPPELSLLRTPRDGRGVSSSVVLALAHVEPAPTPADPAEQALVSPATTLDASVAAHLASQLGAAADWDFVVTHDATSVTITLADLGLAPADALSLPLATLERLAAEAAGGGQVTAGTAGQRYERAAELVGVIGRSPATRRDLSESRAAAPAGDPVDPELVSRYGTARRVAAALTDRLAAQVQLFADGGLGTADEATVRRLLGGCSAWGIAPDVPGPPGVPGLDRLAQIAQLALPQLQARLGSAPDAASAAQLSPAAFVDAATALVSPTGQLAFTCTIPASTVPGLASAPALDEEWLTVVAAVRPALARFEAWQLTTGTPGAGRGFAGWANRSSDPWQTDAQDTRSLVVVYADPALDLTAVPPFVAANAIDQFDEVVPAVEQRTGAAFGFDAPGSRAQQAILLAVPPVTSAPLDLPTLAQILIETRQLAHARMARPADLPDQFWGLAPTGLLPATGAIAIPLEAAG